MDFNKLDLRWYEWIAAQQHKEFYSIYRVYFVRGKVLMYVLNNIHQKTADKKIEAVPLTYRIDFGKDAVDEIIKEEVEKHV